MKKFVFGFVAMTLFGLTAMAQKGQLPNKLLTMATPAIVSTLPATPAPFSCTCSCGWDCSAMCRGHYNPAACSDTEGIGCVMNCCGSAPPPGPGECGPIFSGDDH